MDAPLDGARQRARNHRSRRLGTAVVVLITLLAGAAFAFFVTRQTYANNTVSGGSLKVSSEGLPLDFGGKSVYPTTAKNPSYTVKDEFKVTNTNPVAVGYLLSSTCSECGNGGAKKQQFDNLYVRITPMDQAPVGQQAVYEGRLADLKNANLATLAANASRTFSVEMWLVDTGNEQTQNVKTLFELVLAARTPAAAPSGSPSPSPSLPLP
jgi:hypothetical protein